MNPSSSSSSGGYHPRPAAGGPPQPRGGRGRGGRDGGERMDALGSSSSSTGGSHSMAAAFSSMHLNDGVGTQQRRGGWRGGRGGRDGTERIDALRSSPPSSSSMSAGYHHSSAAADFAPPQPRGGWRGGGGRSGGGGRRGRGSGDPSDRIAALGRLLSRVLRHMAVDLGLDMRPDGYVRVRDLLRLNVKSYAEIPFKAHTVDEIREAVRRDSKQRFSLLEEDGELWVRANQGHSVTTVASESLLKPILSADEVPGIRRDVNILIHLDVRKALHDGMKLYVSDNKVILTEGFDGVVPVKYFEKIKTWLKRTLVRLKNKEDTMAPM